MEGSEGRLFVGSVVVSTDYSLSCSDDQRAPSVASQLT
jgi:hypothetical protein